MAWAPNLMRRLRASRHSLNKNHTVSDPRGCGVMRPPRLAASFLNIISGLVGRDRPAELQITAQGDLPVHSWHHHHKFAIQPWSALRASGRNLTLGTAA